MQQRGQPAACKQQRWLAHSLYKTRLLLLLLAVLLQAAAPAAPPRRRLLWAGASMH